jgi:hypothetical protein
MHDRMAIPSETSKRQTFLTEVEGSSKTAAVDGVCTQEETVGYQGPTLRDGDPQDRQSEGSRQKPEVEDEAHLQPSHRASCIQPL